MLMTFQKGNSIACRVQTARPLDLPSLRFNFLRFKKIISRNVFQSLANDKLFIERLFAEILCMHLHLVFMENSSLSFLFSVVGIVLFCYVLYSHVSRPRSVYGPKTYPIVGRLFSFWRNQHRHLEWFTDMLRESPTQTIAVERLGGINTVVTANPANVEHILRTRFENYPKGQAFTTILQDLLGKGIFNTDGEAWKMQRKVASHEFNTRSLRTFIVKAVENEIADRLLPLLRSSSHKRSCLDMQDVLKRFAFDNICKIAFGMDPHCLDPSLPVSEFGQAFDLATQLSFKRSTVPVSLLWKAKRMLNIGSEKRLSGAIRTLNDFALEVIRRRRREIAGAVVDATPKEDLLSRFMAVTVLKDLCPEPESEGLSEEFMRDIVKSFILAGRDTTAAALTWFFWMLASHPRVEEAVHREILEVIAAGESERATNSGTALPEYDGIIRFSYEELQEMDYLHASICESLRLYPPVAADSKHALQDDVLPDGTFVRRGTRVTYHPYAMGRMESIWGADCLEFKPERWLDPNGRFVRQSPFKFAVFQGGMRICLGREMAFIQMKYIAASVIREFKLLSPDSEFDPKFIAGLTGCMSGGFPVIVYERPKHLPRTAVEFSQPS